MVYIPPSWLVGFVVNKLQMIEVHALLDKIIQPKVIKVFVGYEITIVELVDPPEQRACLLFELD